MGDARTRLGVPSRGSGPWHDWSVVPDSDVEDRGLAERLFALWDHGRGVSKSELERATWGDGSSHGRRFDRFIWNHLGVSTNKPSKQTDRISDLEQQVRSLGGHPVGTDPTDVEIQLQHSRAACLSALRIWNDPGAAFRTGSFSLLFVTAWNSLALALLQRSGAEWRILRDGKPVMRDRVEVALDTIELVSQAFQGQDHEGLRENIRFWVDLRNSVAHRYLPELDVSVIPYAQSGLLNYERVISIEFGDVYRLSDMLSVPLQLSGFRDPDILVSRKRAQATLPLDVQAVLSRAETATPELLTDETFMMRVAFIPVVPASGRNPDAVAYFVRPGEVPSELSALRVFVGLRTAGTGWRVMLSGCRGLRSCGGW